MSGDGAFRNPVGGLIDRTKPITFRWEGRELKGFAGDTLASALVANGIRVAGRSFKYHRPRGLMAAGVEEPNVLVQLGHGGRNTPNVRATEIELVDGIDASPVNCWPSSRFDLGAINSVFSRLLPAGFYYKTFMWPSWRAYEWAIRRAAGMGRAAAAPDPDRYESRYAHCDVLVVGAGPAGLAAASSAAAGGARVILAEQDTRLGGTLLSRRAKIESVDGIGWVDQCEVQLRANPLVRVLTRTTATGCYDHNSVSLVERAADEFACDGPQGMRQRMWEVRARSIVLATGAIERPLIFPGNDRPGVMLATAAEVYTKRYAARPGRRAIVYTNNDLAYDSAMALAQSGIEVAALLDSRAEVMPYLRDRLQNKGIEVLCSALVVGTLGRGALRSVRARYAGGGERTFACDLMAVSGGLDPTVHLFSQAGGQIAFDRNLSCYRPREPLSDVTCAGASNGSFSLHDALAEAHACGALAASRAGFPCSGKPPRADVTPSFTIEWTVPSLNRASDQANAFVDFQNDVTAADIALAARENFRSVEHLKRYTTLGMGTDQGKTANSNGLAMMASFTGSPIEAVGTTRFRPPFTPVALGTFGGRYRGQRFQPTKHLALHDWHENQGAFFEEFGSWQRPEYYPRPGESREEAVRREMVAVRTGAGILDYTPLGKIEVKGPDAGAFLDLIYANAIGGLKPGRLRYGLMLNELGVIIDDGVVARLSPDRFWLTTTSGGAERTVAWLEEWLQCEWPHLKVLVMPLTTVFATVLVSGPFAREVVRAAGCDIDLAPASFPHMTWRDGIVAGVPARVFRASYTGEVSYELTIPADRARELWCALISDGAPCRPVPFGIEALLRLRAEKGFLHIGGDTDGTTIPSDVGWGHVVKRDPDFIGKRSLLQAENQRSDRLQFVGLEPVGGGATPEPGMHLRTAARDRARKTDGFVTAAHFSPALQRDVVLAMVRCGAATPGAEVVLLDGGREFKIAPLAAYDPEGNCLNG